MDEKKKKERGKGERLEHFSSSRKKGGKTSITRRHRERGEKWDKGKGERGSRFNFRGEKGDRTA